MDIGNSFQRGTDVFFAWLPNLLAAIAIIVIGYLVAKLVGGLVHRALRRAGFDGIAHGGPTGGYVSKVVDRPSVLIGTLVKWALFVGAIAWAVAVLGVPALTAFVAAVFGYLPNVLGAILIFLVAGAVAAGVAALARRTMGGTALGTIVATVAPILVMTIATFMILDMLMIARNIVVITYAALLGAIALGSALAFGLGGRDVARRLLEGAYEKGQEHKEEFRQDLDEGMARARAAGDEDATATRERAPARAEERYAGTAPGAAQQPPVGDPLRRDDPTA